MSENPKVEEMKMEEVWKVISMCGSDMLTLQGDHLVATLFSRVTTY
jgi:hypothetical protein